MSYTVASRIIHSAFLELSFLSSESPTGASTPHRSTREVSKRAAWPGTDWALYPTRGVCFAMAKRGTIG